MSQYQFPLAVLMAYNSHYKRSTLFPGTRGQRGGRRHGRDSDIVEADCYEGSRRRHPPSLLDIGGTNFSSVSFPSSEPQEEEGEEDLEMETDQGVGREVGGLVSVGVEGTEEIIVMYMAMSIVLVS